MVNKHNARMDSRQSETKTDSPEQNSPSGETSTDQTSQNPDADQHVDALLASGMTPDDIHAHAKKRSGQQAEQAPEQQQSSALSSIPGM